MKLYIVRHAEAEDTAPTGADADRALTKRGKSRTANAATGLNRLDLGIGTIVTSPLKRALDTAEILAGELGLKNAMRHVPELASGISASQAVTALGRIVRVDAIAVGHEPQLGELISLLLTGETDTLHTSLKKGACVALEFSDRIQPGQGILLWFMTQKQLGNQSK